MPLLQIMTVTSPSSGQELAASRNEIYNTDNIVWATLSSTTGTTASSTFKYLNEDNTTGKAVVKASVGASASKAGVVSVP